VPDQRNCPTPSPVDVWTSDCLLTGIPSRYVSSHTWSTQPGHPFVSRRNQYHRKQRRKQVHRAMHYSRITGLTGCLGLRSDGGLRKPPISTLPYGPHGSGRALRFSRPTSVLKRRGLRPRGFCFTKSGLFSVRGILFQGDHAGETVQAVPRVDSAGSHSIHRFFEFAQSIR